MDTDVRMIKEKEEREREESKEWLLIKGLKEKYVVFY